MTPKKPDWFEMTESGDSYAGIKKVNKKLPIATLVVAGAVILGGSLFANVNNESPAIAETPTASQSVAATQPSAANSNPVSYSAPAATTSNNSSTGVNSLPIPKVTAAPQSGSEHEGRERGERGEHDNKERDHEDRDND